MILGSSYFWSVIEQGIASNVRILFQPKKRESSTPLLSKNTAEFEEIPQKIKFMFEKC